MLVFAGGIASPLASAGGQSFFELLSIPLVNGLGTATVE
jgi:hypothetical protein